MSLSKEQAHSNVIAAYPGLAGKSLEETDALIKQCSREVAQRMKGEALAYMIIAGVVFFACGVAFGATSQYLCLVFAALIILFAGLRVRSRWIAEVRLELRRQYGVAAPPRNGESAA